MNLGRWTWGDVVRQAAVDAGAALEYVTDNVVELVLWEWTPYPLGTQADVYRQAYVWFWENPAIAVTPEDAWPRPRAVVDVELP